MKKKVKALGRPTGKKTEIREVRSWDRPRHPSMIDPKRQITRKYIIFIIP